MRRIRLLIAGALGAALVAACGQMDMAELGGEVGILADTTFVTDGVKTGEGVAPQVVNNPRRGGNVTCDDIGMNGIGSTPRMDFNGGGFSPGLPTWLTVTLSDGNKSLAWAVDEHHLPHGFAGAVIVKGGPSAHVYFYYPSGEFPSGEWTGTDSDSGLTAPKMANGRYPGLSNLTFCKKPHDFHAPL